LESRQLISKERKTTNKASIPKKQAEYIHQKARRNI